MDKEEQLKINERIMNKIDDLTKAVEEIKITLAGLPDEIFARADERYASKLTEKVVYATWGAAGLAIVYAVLNVIIKVR